MDDRASSAKFWILNMKLPTSTGRKANRTYCRPNRTTRKNVDLINLLEEKSRK